MGVAATDEPECEVVWWEKGRKKDLEVGKTEFGGSLRSTPLLALPLLSSLLGYYLLQGGAKTRLVPAVSANTAASSCCSACLLSSVTPGIFPASNPAHRCPSDRNGNSIKLTGWPTHQTIGCDGFDRS